MSILSNYFDKVYCVNLERRTDRWEKVTNTFKEFNFDDVERFEAIDGKKLDLTNVPHNSSLLAGELGLLETNINIIKEAQEKNYGSILILEDDVVFTDEMRQLETYMAALPPDWDMLFLGGNHIYGEPPLIVNDKVLKLNKTYATHCIAIKNTLFEPILGITKKRQKPIDVYYGELQPIFNVYGFTPNLAIQTVEFSDIQNKMVDYNCFFNR
jgi:GR25 family glycosyltransferase involved in LPS biosynthesis